MKIYVIPLVLLLALGCIAPETTGPQTAGPQTGGDAAAEPGPVQAVQAAPDADSIRIPLAELSSTVRHYSYDAGGVNVRYFAVRGSDGRVRTAFDACEVCYRAGKGYSQSGSDVVCNNCGLRFRIDDLGTKNQGSGCWPSYLPHEVDDGNVVIRKSGLETGSEMSP